MRFFAFTLCILLTACVPLRDDLRPASLSPDVVAFPPQNCRPLEVLERHLARVGESRQAIGVTPNGLVVELLTADNGSWSLVTVSPHGVACLLLAGQNWSEAPTEPEGRDG